MEDSKKFDSKAMIEAGFDKALESQQSQAAKNVARLRRVHPDKSPAELIAHMDKWYISLVSTAGASAGAAAAGNGGKALLAKGLVLLTYLEISVLYTLSVAEIHRLNLEDFERRKLLTTCVLLGDAASTKVLDDVIGRTAPYWGKKVVKAIPMTAIDAANEMLSPHFITKWGKVQGVLVLGEQVPRVFGAAIGGLGNGLFGWFVVQSARKILGPAPETWDAEIEDDTPEEPAGQISN